MSNEPALRAEQIQAIETENERQKVVSLLWRQKRVIDFKPSPSNIEKMGNYISSKNLPWVEDSLDEAFDALQDSLEPITPADISAQSQTVSRQITEKKPEFEWPYPLTKKSINSIQPKDFRRWLKNREFTEQLNAALKGKQ